jgi:hypothetical protein
VRRVGKTTCTSADVTLIWLAKLGIFCTLVFSLGLAPTGVCWMHES